MAADWFARHAAKKDNFFACDGLNQKAGPFSL
jgi:hypothetical protein